jgi:hypothetical protein
LDGTSIITTSDQDGKFRLEVQQRINANLIFSHLSYEPLVIQRPFEQIEKSFFLKERVNTLSEVRVVADIFSRAEKMRVFKEEFLGKTAAGISCVILNEEDIVLNYDHENCRLEGYSNKPVVVENRYLAYRVTFDLQNFCVQYLENTLDITKAISISYKGTSSFVDHSPYNIRFAKRREEAYLCSSRYFWKNFVSDTLDEGLFKIYNRFRQIKPEQYFIIIKERERKTVITIPHTNLNRTHPHVYEGRIYGVVNVLCQNKYRSEVVLLTNRFSVDEFGNPDTNDIMYFDSMGAHRLGELLPRDYSYTSL